MASLTVQNIAIYQLSPSEKILLISPLSVEVTSQPMAFFEIWLQQV